MVPGRPPDYRRSGLAKRPKAGTEDTRWAGVLGRRDRGALRVSVGDRGTEAGFGREELPVRPDLNVRGVHRYVARRRHSLRSRRSGGSTEYPASLRLCSSHGDDVGLGA